MSVELNQRTFKRLVQLYLLSFALFAIAIGIELVVWSEFIGAFDELVIEHFGEVSDFYVYSIGGVLIACGIAHIVAAFGLLKFKRWSKSLIWITLIASIPIGLIPGFEFSWAGPFSIWTEFLGSVLLGAILLLAYSREHGAIWFANAGNVEPA